MKTAIIIGVAGQDGSYLAEFLLEKGYIVHGIKRHASSMNYSRVEHLVGHERFHMHYGDVLDFHSLVQLMRAVKPDEIYNLAAQSHVQVSFALPEYTSHATGLGVLNVLESIRAAGLTESVRFYQASTSELYGLVQQTPQTESTPFYPRSPYAVAKLYGFWITKNYREAYKMFACNGILFNHESPRRGENFVTRKITMGVAAIVKGATQAIELGNLDAQRDWGHARDYAECMWLMLQHERPDDFVVATGVTTSVRRFCEMAFKAAGLPIEWQGEGVHEVAIVREGALKGRVVVRVNPKYYRPTEVDLLLGDPSKAKKELGWNPQKTSLEVLVKEMVDHDCGRC